MKSKFKSLVAILALGVLALNVVGCASRCATASVQKWEYKVVSWPDEPQFAELGRDGWELVSTSAHQANGTTDGAQFIFKRPLPPKN